ncbi:regulation of nuclear pre-mRNA domain-containing protein 2-like isoform X2 [Zingiber officinale]|uniref:regulation of nuclear pre-mRNA domain-containing protein 2-like isoform X2 n=1 Tax=Zingiber officinale TaxID=94328 RepID=UPI001C4DBE72|nr:regulation of nuclear pre-mRNA domain-containing protein 2-like isoform X2 [Zingiber officinale]
MTNGPFNEQILADKLLNLNSTQHSIETLSHWCIFHRKKAKEVVEMWLHQFHLASRDQRISFLFLANDIVQNSRRKGLEFIEEFWKVLPDVLNGILDNGNDVEKNIVHRLINIWEQRKVFGSHESLKQDMLTKNIDSRNRNGKGISYKLKQPGGEQLQKLISAYSDASGFPFDEETLLDSCQAAVNFVESFETDTWNQRNFHGSGTVKELVKYHEVLRDSIKKLKAVESTRAIIVACLKEALLEQEIKYSQVRQQLKAAQSGYQLSVNLCNQFNIDMSPDRRLLESPDHGPPGFSSNYAFEYVEGNQKAGNSTSSTLEAAPDVPQLVASTSSTFEAVPGAPQLADLTISTQMQDHAQQFVRSNGIVGPTIEEDLQSNNKRLKLEDDPRVSFQPQPQFVPPFPPLHPNTLNQPSSQPPVPVTYPDSTVELLPPPPLTPFPPPPPLPPLPVAPVAPAFTPLADLTIASTYGYAPAPPFPNYQMVGFPPHPVTGNQYGFQAPEGSNYADQPPFRRLPPPPPPPPPLA